MHAVELSAGPIAYRDTGGDGPTLVLVHGLVMDNSLWDAVIARLDDTHRCIAPTLPLGGHRAAMRPTADLGLGGQAALLGEFIDRLGLEDIVLVANDWGGPILTAVDRPDRLTGLALIAVEAFDNIPPGLPGRVAAAIARVPGGVGVAARALRVPRLRRLPITLGWMTATSISDDMARGWTHGLVTDRGVRHDLRRYATTDDTHLLDEACRRLAHLDVPSVVMWSRTDRVMPPDHARRLADLLPRAELIWCEDGRVLLPLDRPDDVANAIRRLAAR